MNEYDRPGAHLVTGDTMTDEAGDWIYVHVGPSRYVAWDEAKQNSVSIPERRRQQQESRAREQAEHERKQAELARQLGEIHAVMAEYPALAQMIRTWHDTLGWECAAESGSCCIDELLAGTN